MAQRNSDSPTIRSSSWTEARREVKLGLSIGAGGSTVRGLVINRFAAGILLSGGGGNHIEGNYIGTDVTGTLALGNQYNGIAIEASSNNTIGGTGAGAGNVIAGNGQDGIEVNGTGNAIQGNYIGVGADGSTALGNKGNGIRFINSNNVVGGTLEARAMLSPAMASTACTTRTAPGS